MGRHAAALPPAVSASRSEPRASAVRQFGPYALDSDNACLWHRDQAIPVTPRVFAVLSYLVERAGRLVSTAELLQGVWPDTHVQPQVLRTYILEIRKLLGDRASHPVFIQTLPKRGYRFLAAVSAVADAAQATPPESCSGRTVELAALAALMERAAAGRRQVAFVTGETGIGKTFVVDAFVARHAGTPAGIRIARGQCVEGYAGVEPHYVLFEALADLCGSRASRATLDLFEIHAPSWLRQLSGAIRASGHAGARANASGATMVREFCELIDAMSAERPLVLVLEDLQWVDRAALDVLSALARRRQPARLLVLGTYRPADVAHGGHPLRGLKHDLVLHRLGHDIALQPLDAAWVRRRLEQELGSTAIGGAVTSFVLRYSDGNPLFVDAIIQHLRTHGLLCLQHGFWTQKGALDGQTGLPAALAQLFELQAGQLPAGDQQLLETASVAGRAFSARMIADALDEGVEPVEERLEHLAAARQFIHRVSEGRDALSPTLYGFEHALVREALSRKVPPTRRGRLLARMASARDGGPRAIAAAGS